MKPRTLFVLVALVVAGVLPLLRAGSPPVFDLAAERLIEGAEIYRTDDAIPAFSYPPFMALAYLPFHLLPEDHVRRSAWYLVNLLLLGLAIDLLRPSLAPLWRDAPGRSFPVFAGLLAALSFVHLASPIENESHDLIVLALIAGMVMADRQRAEGAAGAMAGLAAAAKATPLLFLPILLWQRRWRAAAAMVAAILAATLLPDLLFPRAEGGLWVEAWYGTFVARTGPGAAADAAGAWASWNALNQSLAGSLHRLLTPVPAPAGDMFDVSLWAPDPAVAKGIILAAQAAVLALLVRAVRLLPGMPRMPAAELGLFRYGTASAVVSAMLLLSPMSSKSHFCVLILPLSWCLADFWFRERDRVVGTLLAAAFLLGLSSARDLLGRPLVNELQARGSTALCALVCLIATARVLHLRRAAARRGLPLTAPIETDIAAARPAGSA